MRRIFTLAALVCALFCLRAPAFADAARDITNECRLNMEMCENSVFSMRDRNIESVCTAGKQVDPVVSVTVGDTPCAGAYVDFGFNIFPIEAQVKRDGMWVKIGENTQSDYAQSYIAFETVPAGGRFRLVFKSEGAYRVLAIRELYLFSEGEKSDIVHEWQPSVEKADLMVLSAHPDDEVLWFGGTLPYYAGEKGLNVVVSYMTCGNSCRRIELLDGIWHCGVRTYPDIGSYRDKKPDKIGNMYYEWGGRGAVYENLVARVRRFKPEVIVTHALDGEYGHPAHLVCSDAMLKVVEMAALPEVYPESAKRYGVWQVKKLYLHKGAENVNTMNWRLPLSAFGGKTGYDVAVEAYDYYITQPHKPGYYVVADENHKHNSFIYTLAYSAVGQDVLGGDFFENIRTDTRPDAAAE